MTDQVTRAIHEAQLIGDKMWRRRDRKRQGPLGQIIAQLQQIFDPSTGGVPPSALPPLAGDVTGPPGANTVVKIQGIPVSTTDPTTGQVPTYDGTSYVPTTPTGTGHTIQDEGVSLTQRTLLDFVGAGVTVTDAGGKTVVTIPSSGVTDATYVTRTAHAGLSAEVLLSEVYAHELKTRYEPLTDGDLTAAELIFAAGDCVMVEIPL